MKSEERKNMEHMNATGTRFNLSNVIAACIVAIRLVTAALIMTHRPRAIATDISLAKSVATLPFTQEAVGQQFRAQMLAALALHTVHVRGVTATLKDVDVSRIVSTPKDDIYRSVYRYQWWGRRGWAMSLGNSVKLSYLLVFTLLFVANLAMAQVPAKEKSVSKPLAIYQNTSYYNKKQYEFSVWSDQLEKAPLWMEDAEDPPLSPRKAIASARADLVSILPTASKWDMESVELAPLGGQYWIYLVKFSLSQRNYNGPESAITVVVMMDGTAIKPSVNASIY